MRKALAAAPQLRDDWAMRLFAFLCLFLLASAAAAKDSGVPEPIVFDAWNGPPLRVYALRPDSAADDAPVVFVMHGVNRDADRYFAEWRPLAERYGFVIVVPEFSSSDFPRADNYNLGGVVGKGGRAADRNRWAFSAIEPMFDFVRERFGLAAERYVLYGHSAGAQFAHRFALFGAGPRARMVISANAGWYTFPDAGKWPYGPDGLPAEAFDPAEALAAPLVVLAGEADIDPNHPSLRRTPEAMAQGATRFARARAFYLAGAKLSVKLGAGFGWSCVTAPGVDHDDAKAAPFAVALILGPPPRVGAPCYKGERAD